MRLFPLSAALAAILTAGSLPAVVIEENFKGYADYDPAHENWMFRGVGGEVIGGAGNNADLAEGGEETLPEETENGEAPAADAEEPAEGIDPAEAGAVVVD